MHFAILDPYRIWDSPKTFVPLANAADASGSSLKRPKVFWFFFSKKELLSRADLI
jgi:hypothetical protein